MTGADRRAATGRRERPGPQTEDPAIGGVD